MFRVHMSNLTWPTEHHYIQAKIKIHGTRDEVQGRMASQMLMAKLLVYTSELAAPWLKTRGKRCNPKLLLLPEDAILVTTDRQNNLVVATDTTVREKFRNATVAGSGITLPHLRLRRVDFQCPQVVEWALNWGSKDLYTTVQEHIPCFDQKLVRPPVFSSSERTTDGMLMFPIPALTEDCQCKDWMPV